MTLQKIDDLFWLRAITFAGFPESVMGFARIGIWQVTAPVD